MKEILDWKSKETVRIWNDLNLWSAPFGQLLLEHIPMQQGWTVLDIGFGTGFPLIELSQRFGKHSKVYGIDIWEEAIKLVKNKIATLDLQNITILEESATKINIPNDTIDLITSNLGINNFDEKDLVYAEIFRVLKPKGKLCITTNPIGTFHELFDVFEAVCVEMQLPKVSQKFKNSIAQRKTKNTIIQELEARGLSSINSVSAKSNLRFVNAEAVMNHAIVRIGFRAYWEVLVNKTVQHAFFENVQFKINQIISKIGEFKMTIPVLYLEFEK